MTVDMHVDPSVLSYRVEIRPEIKAAGGVVYIATIPDLPGCMSHGSTIEDARQNLEDAKREYLAALEERRLPIPAPAPEQGVGSVTWTVVELAGARAEVGSVRIQSRTEVLEPTY